MTAPNEQRALRPSHDCGTLVPSRILHAPLKLLQTHTKGLNICIDIQARPYKHVVQLQGDGQRRRDRCPIIFGGHCMFPGHAYYAWERD